MLEKNFPNEQILTEDMLPSATELAAKMPGGFFIYRADDEGEIFYVNDVMLDIFGCKTLDEFKNLTGNTFRGMVHPDDYEAVDLSIKNQIAKNEKHLDYVEYRIKRLDGSIRWVDDYGRFAHNKKFGDIFYVFIYDVTAHRIASEENYRRAKIIEALSVEFNSIYLLNLDSGGIRPYRLRGERCRSIIETLSPNSDGEYNWLEIFPAYAEKYVMPEDRELYFKEIKESRIRERLKNESSYNINYRCQKENGDIIYLEMSIVKIEDDLLKNNIVIGYRDITAQVKLVQKELTAKLKMETELEREKRTNEIKTAFLFNISHDLRTPMNSIMGFTELARRYVENPERLKNYLDKVDESNRHLLALIDDLLDMSSLDFERIEIKSDVCNLKEQLDMIVDIFIPQATEKKITLERNFNLPNKNIFVDSLRFRRVMGNLISNAVKFTPENGKVTITARQKKISDSGYARYEFSVIDNGVGMSEEFIAKMFEAFEREETSTKSGYLGTGLGLSITKRILDIMGGSISVKSKKGEGTTFTVDLPLKFADDAENLQENISAAEVQKSDEAHKILIVEDIEVNRMLAEAVLTEFGFEVESVPDGCDAVDAVKKNPEGYYDLILMDIQMPVMNGYEATRAIRALNRDDAKHLPIIALSANARDEDKKMSIESGMNDHIAKPFDIANLIGTISAYISANE